MQLLPRTRLMKTSRSPSIRNTILLAALTLPLAQAASAQDATGIKVANLIVEKSSGQNLERFVSGSSRRFELVSNDSRGTSLHRYGLRLRHGLVVADRVARH